MPYLINPLIETELVHFCAGPSGVGKTRWLLPMLQNQWRLGRDVLGHRSYPTPWCYVPMDRPYRSAETTFLSLGLDPLLIKVIPAADLKYKSICEVLDHADKMGAKFVVIEMFSYLLRGQHTRETVYDFMMSVQGMLAQSGMTILGTMESPKMTPRDTYKNPRQRISGPVSWGHCAETIFMLEYPPAAIETSNRRILRVLPRNGEAEIYPARFYKNGHLYLDKKGVGSAEGEE